MKLKSRSKSNKFVAVVIVLPIVWITVTTLNVYLLTKPTIPITKRLSLGICVNMPHDFPLDMRSPESAHGLYSEATGRSYNVHFTTYGNKKFEKTLCRITRQAERSGWFQSVRPYGPSDVPVAFMKRFQEVMGMARGGGYWLWRFPIMRLALKNLPEGHFVAFADSGCALSKTGKHNLIAWLDELHDSNYDEIGVQYQDHQSDWNDDAWTTERIHKAFNVSKDNIQIRQSGQYLGGILLFRNGPHMEKILSTIEAVLDQDPYLITDKYNEETKAINPRFVDNRHDQSLHSVARKVHGCVNLTWLDEHNSPFPDIRLRYPSWEKVRKMEEKERSDTTPW